jgi:hypothetical protein
MVIIWIDPLFICLVCVAFCDLISICVVLVFFMLTASRSLFLYMLTWMIKLILVLDNFLTSCKHIQSSTDIYDTSVDGEGRRMNVPFYTRSVALRQIAVLSAVKNKFLVTNNLTRLAIARYHHSKPNYLAGITDRFHRFRSCRISACRSHLGLGSLGSRPAGAPRRGPQELPREHYSDGKASDRAQGSGALRDRNRASRSARVRGRARGSGMSRTVLPCAGRAAPRRP